MGKLFRSIAIAAALALGSTALATVTGTASRNDLVADGVTTVYAFTFPCTDKTWVQVQLGGAVQSSGYAVTLNANQSSSPGGTVTFYSAPAASTAVRIQRVAPILQGLHLVPGGGFPSSSVEAALDRPIYVLQQLERDRTDRAAVQTAKDSQQDAAILSGDAALNAQIATQLAAVRGLNGNTTIADAATVLPAGASASKRLDALFAEIPSVTHFGAVADWSDVTKTGTDNTAAFQSAVNAASSCVRVPAGKWYVPGPVSIPAGKCFVGAGSQATQILNGASNSTIFKVAGAGSTRTQEVTISGLSLYSNAAASATVLDLRGGSYVSLDDLRIFGAGDRDVSGNLTATSSANASTAICIDATSGALDAAAYSGATTYTAGQTVVSDGVQYVSLQGANLNHTPVSSPTWWLNLWNGYLRFHEVKAMYCDVGLKVNANQVEVIGGLFNAHKTRGIWVTGTSGQYSANVSIVGPEVSGNAKAQAAAWTGSQYDKGGILVDNAWGVLIAGVWHEYNAPRENTVAYGPNDVEVLEASTRYVRVFPGRPDVSKGGPVYGRASTHGVEFASGRSFHYGNEQGLIPNGSLRWLDGSNYPLGWTVRSPGTVTSTAASSTLPVPGRRFTGHGFMGLYRQVLTAADCVALAGKTITLSYYANALTGWSTSGTAGAAIQFRTGLSTSSTGVYDGGVQQTVLPTLLENVPGHYSHRYTITGTEPSGVFVYFLNNGSVSDVAFELGNISATLSDFETLAPEQVLTSAGGEVWNATGLKLGGKVHGWAAGAPASCAVGDVFWNLTPAAGGPPGWVCTATDTPKAMANLAP